MNIKTLVAATLIIMSSQVHADMTENERKAGDACLAATRDKLKDPQSMQYKKMISSLNPKSNDYTVLFEMNAKNGYGGYGNWSIVVCTTDASFNVTYVHWH